MLDSNLKDIFEAIETTKETINYLKKNKIEMIDLAVHNIQENNKEYISKLEIDNNVEIFKDSIIEGHIQWIIEDLYNPSSISFNEFNIYTIKNIPQAYYDIYTSLDKHINNSSVSQGSKEILKDYFSALSEIFK